ncbi:MAG: hypothetical protein IT361_04640 [Gemmatimonadaceae bacterium]|nr:hypothetical protein [Gemmatimonadaceae bacterium]
MKTVALLAVLLAGACSRSRASGPALADTARGTIEVVGSEPATVTLVQDAERLQLVGAGRDVLASLGGIEIVVAGTRRAAAGPALPAPATFEVASFIVRAVGGVSAHDGLVRRDAGTWVIDLRDGGRVATPHLPETLRIVGARVYLVGPLDRPPQGYGLVHR